MFFFSSACWLRTYTEYVDGPLPPESGRHFSPASLMYPAAVFSARRSATTAYKGDGSIPSHGIVFVDGGRWGVAPLLVVYTKLLSCAHLPCHRAAQAAQKSVGPLLAAVPPPRLSKLGGGGRARWALNRGAHPTQTLPTPICLMEITPGAPITKIAQSVSANKIKKRQGRRGEKESGPLF